MSGLDALLALAEKFTTAETITVHPERCLNARFRLRHCTLCADACPTDAIRVTGGTPSLNPNDCVHCGVCLHHCPTEAFTRTDSLPAKLVQTAAALPHQPVDLLCPRHPTPDRGPAAQAIQTHRCLAGLSPATLVELAVQGPEIWLDDTPCAACPLGAVHPVLQETVAQANGWAALLARARPIRLRTEERPEAETARARSVYDATQPPLPRRGLLGIFKKAGQEITAADEKIEMIRVGKDIPVTERLPQALPPQRKKLLDLLQQAAPPAEVAAHPLPIADISIDPARCTACGLCARFCPTAALKFLSDGSEFALALQPALCLGERCGICLPACPEDALTLRPAQSSAAVLRRKPLILGRLGRCARCEEPIAVGEGLPDTCFACRPRNAGDLIKSLVR
ncbi:MAG: hypothetical protein D6784_03065 [Chloroflexi bacterium]|nr:MAG: hypothetical protein D6784_03065 [Chloroflexota bacterium]